MGIKILQGGLLTSVQDLGRFGYQIQGVSPAGPMDDRSFRLANILVGNEENAAGLEMTLIGPMMRFTSDTVFAITGADFAPKLNGRSIPNYCAVQAGNGDTLTWDVVRSGCRAYMAFAGGGLDVPTVLGSKSTLVRAQFGGYKGRKLETGDEIPFVSNVGALPNMTARCIQAENFQDAEPVVRVLLGPQDDRFTEAGIDTFFSNAYQISDQSDRMGIRLKGEKLEHKTDANIISDGIAFGSVQVPGNGMPIIMMAERQSVGGYTKIANIISVDLPILAQRKPGEKIRFTPIDIETAQTLYLEQQAKHRALAEKIAEVPAYPEVHWALTIDGKTYDVRVQRKK